MRKPTVCLGKNKDADQLRGNHEADQRLCFRNSESTIPLLLISEISSFYLSSVIVQPGLCRTCSETTLLVFLRDGSFLVILLPTIRKLQRNPSKRSKSTLISSLRALTKGLIPLLFRVLYNPHGLAIVRTTVLVYRLNPSHIREKVIFIGILVIESYFNLDTVGFSRSLSLSLSLSLKWLASPTHMS